MRLKALTLLQMRSRSWTSQLAFQTRLGLVATTPPVCLRRSRSKGSLWQAVLSGEASASMHSRQENLPTAQALALVLNASDAAAKIWLLRMLCVLQ